MTLCHGTLKLLTSYKSIKFCVFISGLDWSVNCFWWITLVIYVHVLLCSFLFIYVQYNLVHLKKLLGKIFFFNYSFSEVFFFQMPLLLFWKQSVYSAVKKKKKPKWKNSVKCPGFPCPEIQNILWKKKESCARKKKKGQVIAVSNLNLYPLTWSVWNSTEIRSPS